MSTVIVYIRLFSWWTRYGARRPVYYCYCDYLTDRTNVFQWFPLSKWVCLKQSLKWTPVVFIRCTTVVHVADCFSTFIAMHDDVIKWKYFPRYWPFVREIHRSPVNFPHKGQWRGALMFTLICARKNGWVNNGEAGDLRRYLAHYDVIVMDIVDIHCNTGIAAYKLNPNHRQLDCSFNRLFRLRSYEISKLA